MPAILHAVAFMAGDFVVQQLPRLPSPSCWVAWLAAALLFRVLAVRWSAPGPLGGASWRLRAATFFPLLTWFLLGLVLAGWRADWALGQRLNPALEGRELRVDGEVIGLPSLEEGGRRFRLRPTAAFDEEADPTLTRPLEMPALLSLGWYPRDASVRLPQARAGEQWRLWVRLRVPHGLGNPGLFDVELRALEDGVGATGSVRRAERMAGGPSSWRGGVDALRDRLRRAMRATSGHESTAESNSPAWRATSVLIALAVGDQNAIPASDWLLFQQTGVSHLMSISGMHVTMLGAAGGLLVKAMLASHRLAAWALPWVARTTLVRLGAVLAAFAYAQLAGWGLPAQRTFWMLAAAAVAGILGRSRSTTDILAVAGAVVVALDPWAVLSIGFWLSFCAVAVLIWAGQSLPPLARAPGHATARVRWRETAHSAAIAQAAATIALAPLSVWFFASFSLIGPLANLFSIPIVTFLITPAALLGALLAPLLPSLAGLLVQPASWLTQWLLEILAQMAQWPIATLVIAQPPFALLALAGLGGAWLFAPRAVPGRGLGLLLMIPALIVPRERPPVGELWLTAYDVGQGSALLLETQSQSLLYDTGPRIGPSQDAANRVLVPSLRARGIDALDRLIVSHADQDHIGGAATLLRDLRVARTFASLPAGHPMQAYSERCERGLAWTADGVRFTVLHPAAGEDPAGQAAGKPHTNAMSCVLAVDAPGGRILLTGDLEAAQEHDLIERFAGEGALKADVLVVPHHGSKTSSSGEFLQAVAPSYAIAQLGWYNRYRHPDAGVMARYAEAGIPVLRTDADGALRVVLAPGAKPKIQRFRVDEARYWRSVQAWR